MNADNRVGIIVLSRQKRADFCLPDFLLKTFIRIADKNIKLGVKYGKVAVTAVGMFSKDAVWLIPHGSATVLISATRRAIAPLSIMIEMASVMKYSFFNITPRFI